MSRHLYLDCEFNGTRGSFLSMGIYDPKEGINFYEVSANWKDLLKYSYEYGGMQPWVLDNVIPCLNKKAIDELELSRNLQAYLVKFEDPIIYADWPEDFVHLMSMLHYTPPNTIVPMKLVSNLKMELITTPGIYISAIPHNALEDAKALYHNHMEMLKNVVTSS